MAEEAKVITEEDIAVSDKSAAPSGLTTGEIAFHFKDIKWSQERWMMRLNDPSPWLKSCKVTAGRRGNNGQQSKWDPFSIAKAMTTRVRVTKNEIERKALAKKLNLVFVHTDLQPYSHCWSEHFSLMFRD